MGVDRELNFTTNKLANCIAVPSVNACGCRMPGRWNLNEYPIFATRIAAHCLGIEITLNWEQSKWGINFLGLFPVLPALWI